jgi:hypothetical protein
MLTRILALVGAVLLISGSVATAALLKGAERHVVKPDIPGTPYIEVISPRDGSKPRENAVVVKVKVHNFTLAPAQFGKPPQLGEGMIRFSLNKVPEGVSESEAEQAASNPLGSGRLVGRTFDCPRYSGPNGMLAHLLERKVEPRAARRRPMPPCSSFSPATEPQIYYHNLPTGLFRLVITLAQNDGTPTPYHAVTHFRIE